MASDSTLIEFSKQINDAVAALIEAKGMEAENMQRQIQGDSMAYTERDFLEILKSHELEYNSMIEKMRRFY